MLFPISINTKKASLGKPPWLGNVNQNWSRCKMKKGRGWSGDVNQESKLMSGMMYKLRIEVIVKLKKRSEGGFGDKGCFFVQQEHFSGYSKEHVSARLRPWLSYLTRQWGGSSLYPPVIEQKEEAMYMYNPVNPIYYWDARVYRRSQGHVVLMLCREFRLAAFLCG